MREPKVHERFLIEKQHPVFFDAKLFNRINVTRFIAENKEKYNLLLKLILF